jgi:endonuclease/exonuclease/phosphatase family metal-dependent hydrolase
MRNTRHRLFHLARQFLILAIIAYTLVLSLYLLVRLIFGDRFWLLAFANNFAPFYFFPLAFLVPLTLFLKARRAFLLTLPLVLVGSGWVGPYFIPKSLAAPTGPTLRVATFNVWGDNLRLSEVEAWLRQTDADLVVLQEIPASYADHGIPSLKNLYPYQFNQSWQWGNFLMSRYPFRDGESLDMMGNGSRPGQQRIVIDVGGQPVAIYNIHFLVPMLNEPRLSGRVLSRFNNPFLNLALSYEDTWRNVEIRNLLKRLETEPYPFIVAGDFNTSDQSVIYGELAARMGDSFREAGTGFGTSWPLPVAKEIPDFVPPLVRIDYIWHSRHFRAINASQGPRLGSDHLPLFATLELISKTNGMNEKSPSP